MPLIPSSYKAPGWLPGKHAETIIPNLMRKVEGIQYTRERITTQDGDFLDLDWSCTGSSKLVIIAHGLEGNTSRPYVLGMVKEMNAAGWDALSWNFRSCSGEINKVVQLYHAGLYRDLAAVISHALSTKRYKEVALIGFSIGGNIVLKYLAETAIIPSEIFKAAVFSVPCNLKACVEELSLRKNRVYVNNFLETLRVKLEEKIKLYPELLAYLHPKEIRSLIDFDNLFTAPLNGFKNAYHYYEVCSSKHNIPDIRTPVLIVCAQNDPFLNQDCFPLKECADSKWVSFELPEEGGHLGFMKKSIHGRYWSEERVLKYLAEAS
jgi:uncharacterized protein